jgi:hypothetical protein
MRRHPVSGGILGFRRALWRLIGSFFCAVPPGKAQCPSRQLPARRAGRAVRIYHRHTACPFFSQKLHRHPANGPAGVFLKSMYKFLSMQPQKQTFTNRCSFCGATSYRRVVARDAAGAMRYAERLVCTGCTREFPSVKVWREGVPDSSPAPAPAP